MQKNCAVLLTAGLSAQVMSITMLAIEFESRRTTPGVFRYGAVITIAAVLGIVVSITSKAYASSKTEAVGGGCSKTSLDCPICEVDGCHILEDQFLIGPLEDPAYFKRCVEYDGTPPAHCAWVLADAYAVCEWSNAPLGYDVVGGCFRIHCATGTPTAEVCSNPWVAPWTAPNQEMKS